MKTVGTWTEDDVSNWLSTVGLAQYAPAFKAKHVNGRVLLGMHKKDLDSLAVMKLHQRRFSSAVSTLFNGLNWNEDEVAEWMESVGLSELTPNLYKAHINGQSLLMLSKRDLAANDITDPVTQKRILVEIQHLKETEARVPVKDELYRFKILRSVLKPMPTDTKDDTFRFSKEVLEVLKHIYSKCESGQQDSELNGLTQACFKRFIFFLWEIAGIYHNKYPTKNIWIDINTVELQGIKLLVDELEGQIYYYLYVFTRFQDNIEKMAEYVNTEQKRFFALNYLILSNIARRLFAIFDRHVDGVISWNELLPSLELIIYGSTDDKFKLAICLVDFNGDGDIAKEEFLEFYKECFVPIVTFCKVSTGPTKFVEFETLSEDSFLFVAHQKIADVIAGKGGKEPILLNKSFSVEQYHGYWNVKDRKADPDDIFNVPWDDTPLVWAPYGYHQHELKEMERNYGCDACYEQFQGDAWTCKDCDFDLCPSCYYKRSNNPAKNVDILGVYTNGAEFTLTNITFGGKWNCHSLSVVKHAMLWVTHKRPELEAYVKFNDFNKELADAYDGDQKFLFITTDPAENFIANIDLKKPLVGKYILIKLIDTFTEEEIRAARREAKKTQENQIYTEDAAESAQNEKNGDEKGVEREKEEKGKGKDKGDDKGEKEKIEEKEKDREAEHGEEGGDNESNLGDSQIIDNKSDYASKCIVVEFIGLWGLNGRAQNPSQVEANKLFSELVAKYDVIGSSKKRKTNSDPYLNLNEYTTEFLKTARDHADGSEDLSKNAKKLGIRKEVVADVLGHLNYLTIVGDNPANTFMLIRPIIHLLRLFFGHDIFDILTKPM